MPKFNPLSTPSVVANPIKDQNVFMEFGNQGNPAAIIGTAATGPAFVPFAVTNALDFGTIFGPREHAVDNENFGMIGATAYLDNGGQEVTFLRLLGAGDCNPRVLVGPNSGMVNNAGFVVGQEIVNTGSGLVGPNVYAGSTAVAGGNLGRAYFLSTLMSESAGSDIFSAAGLQAGPTAVPIIRGMLFAPSGVVLSLSSTLEPNNTPTSDSAALGVFGTSGDGGCNIGSVNKRFGYSIFTLLLNGHKNKPERQNSIIASFDPSAKYSDIVNSGQGTAFDFPPGAAIDGSDSLYFANVFNRDPTKIQELGHYLHLHYDISSEFAVATGSGVVGSGVDYGEKEPIAFLLTSSLPRNTGSETDPANDTIGVPNFENFQDRFTHGYSPFVVSQKIGNARYNLFRFVLTSAGEALRDEDLKFIVSNIRPGAGEDDAAQFDITLHRANETEIAPLDPIETFENCSLDPSSEDFIVRVVGDRNAYYDFDQTAGTGKIVVEGSGFITNAYVRVEVSKELSEGLVPREAIPVGFRGIAHLVTSGSSVTAAGSILTGSHSANATFHGNIGTEVLKSVMQPPLPLRERLSLGLLGQKLDLANGLSWGVQYNKKHYPPNPNSTATPSTLPMQLLSYLPSFQKVTQNMIAVDNPGTPDVGGCVLDADRYNNNLFTMENIAVITGTASIKDLAGALPASAQWPAALYIRDGKLPETLQKADGSGASDKVRFVDPSRDFYLKTARDRLSFTVPFHRGFDGVNMFDDEAARMTDISVHRARSDSGISNFSSPTIAAHHRAIDIVADKTNTSMRLLSIPGIRHRAITDKAVQTVDENFDSFFITDVEEFDVSGTYITSSLQSVDTSQVAKKFNERFLDSSFVAAYFPDIKMNVIPDSGLPPSRVPPTVGMLGAYAQLDELEGSHKSPMGQTRGAIPSAISTMVGLNTNDIGVLIEHSINPISEEQNAGGAVYPIAQKTTLRRQSSVLRRVNVRRVIIDIRRSVRMMARAVLFEQNPTRRRESFKRALDVYMAQLTTSGIIQEFRVTLERNPSLTATQMADPRSGDLVEAIKLNVAKFKPFGQSVGRDMSNETELKTIRASIFIRPNASDEFVQIEVNENDGGA